MHKLKIATLTIFSIAVLGVIGCKKSTEEIQEDVTPNVTTMLSGAEWTTKVAGGVSSTVFVITASKDQEAIVLTIPTKAVGIYPIDGVNNMAIYMPIIDSLDASYIAYGGSIEITDMNFTHTQFNGTFEFVAIDANLDTINVTAGILKNIPAK